MSEADYDLSPSSTLSPLISTRKRTELSANLQEKDWPKDLGSGTSKCRPRREITSMRCSSKWLWIY